MGKSLAAAKPALKDIKKDASKFIKSSKAKRLQAQLSKVHAYGKSPRMTKDEKRIILQMASERNMPPIKIVEQATSTVRACFDSWFFNNEFVNSRISNRPGNLM